MLVFDVIAYGPACRDVIGCFVYGFRRDFILVEHVAALKSSGLPVSVHHSFIW